MHPFLQFPQLFFLSFYVPTLLRVVVALLFFYIAWQTYARRDELARLQLPVVGKAAWAIWFAVIVEILIGLSLFFGYYTQFAAIIGALAALKFFILKRRIGGYAPISKIASLLLLTICLSLVISGAGALAMDVPL
jgi:uncharacterized membrane protein YphA (DoxX/SURF4 family)